MKPNLTATERFELCICALLVASEAERVDLLPPLKELAQQAASEMNAQRQRAAQRGRIRRVANRSGTYQ